MQTGQWEYAGLTFEGLSLAGVRTCITLPQYSIALDVAQGLPYAIGMGTFLITHGHLDHAAGIPYIIAQKSLNSHATPRFLMPEEMVAPLKEIMRMWFKIVGHEYSFEFIGARAGENYPIQSNLLIRPFPTFHSIPSLGYSIYQKGHKLRSDLIGQTSDEIAKVRLSGEDPTEETLKLLVSYTGDTQIDFLDRSPEVCQSKILIMEATYLDEKKTAASTKDWGHTHLDALLPKLAMIKSEKIVLIHTSARYSFEEAQLVLQRKLPEREKERIVIFPGR